MTPIQSLTFTSPIEAWRNAMENHIKKGQGVLIMPSLDTNRDTVYILCAADSEKIKFIHD